MNQFDKQNDSLWKFGILYFNPKDPSLFVEKRTGLGWTLNFANKYAYGILLILILLVLTLTL